MPDHESDTYRLEVQSRVQTLLSGQRERNPDLERMSTSRLILEGVVEELKIYRMHKQDQATAKSENEMGGDKVGRRERGKGEGKSGYKHLEERGRRPRKVHDPDRHGSRERSRDKSPTVDGGGESKRRSHRRKRDVPDSVTVTSSPQDLEPEYMITGGAGPPGTLPLADHNPSYRSSPTQGRHHHEHPKASNQNRRPIEDADNLPSSTGPNSPANVPGNLPKYKFKIGPALGFGDHVMGTYQHIKAEQDAGKREKGMFEKFLESKAEKKSGDTGAKAVKDKQVRFEDAENEEADKDGKKSKGKGKAGMRVERDANNQLRVVKGVEDPTAPSRQHARKPHSSRQSRRERSPQFVYDIALPAPLPDHPQLEGEVQEPRTNPVIPHGHRTPMLKKAPPTPKPARIPPHVQPLAPLAAPPPSATPSPFSQASTLLDDIRKGKRLRKVDKSTKPIYKQTTHSHVVEEREQAEAEAEAAAEQQEENIRGEEPSDTETDWQSDRAPNRTFRQQLGDELEARSNVGGSRESPENVMGPLAAEVAAPTWDWSNLDRSRGGK